MIQSRTAAADTVDSAYLGTIYVNFKYLLISLLAGKILFFFTPVFEEFALNLYTSLKVRFVPKDLVIIS